VLGVFEEVEYEEESVDLQLSDMLVLFTDGVVESADEEGREFGVKRLVQTVTVARELSAFKTVRSILDATRAFSGTDSFADDFTVVVVKR
jgi:sigma-B regulation protein RsbU (phosphoserine phosphatase)